MVGGGVSSVKDLIFFHEVRNCGHQYMASASNSQNLQE